MFAQQDAGVRWRAPQRGQTRSRALIGALQFQQRRSAGPEKGVIMRYAMRSGVLRAWVAALGAALLFGCASYSGNSLVAGSSTEADIVALMGPPDEKLKLDNGDSVWFYPRWVGRQTYAITVGPDGRFRSSVQRLDRTYIDQIRRDTWTTKTVRALLGPPYQVTRFERQQRDVWTYRWQEYSDRRLLHVQFSYDGVVREVLDMMDPEYLPMGPGVFKGVGLYHAHWR